MSKIDAQIQELILKKKKVELLNLIVSGVSPENIKSEDSYSEVRSEVFMMVKAFVDAQVEMIEEAREQSDNKADEAMRFSNEEFQVLKDMVRKLLAKAPQAPTQPLQPINVPTTNLDPKPDKIRFALQNRHLESKQVRINTDLGPVNGRVVGLDAPYIVVKTETGFTTQVTIENLQVIP